MTYPYVLHMASVLKEWQYVRYSTWQNWYKARALRNRLGTFYFSEDQLVAFVATSARHSGLYRNKLFIVQNEGGSRVLGRHLNKISPDKSIRVSGERFYQLFHTIFD